MASVVYAHTGMGMGLAFAEMRPTQQANLSSWLRELAGEPPERETPSEIPSQADMSSLQAATIRDPIANAKGVALLEALRELVSLLGNKRVLTEAEVELLRDKMDE
jgi:hypothetical protein